MSKRASNTAQEPAFRAWFVTWLETMIAKSEARQAAKHTSH